MARKIRYSGAMYRWLLAVGAVVGCASPAQGPVQAPVSSPTAEAPECAVGEGLWSGSFTRAGACETATLEVVADQRETAEGDPGEPVRTHARLRITSSDGRALREHLLSEWAAGDQHRVYKVVGVVPIPGPESVVVVHERIEEPGRNSAESLELWSCSGSDGCVSMVRQVGESLEVENTGPGELDYVERSPGQEHRFRLVFHDGKFARTPRD